MPRAKLPYTSCKLYVDGADGIAVGDYIVTSGGSAYLIQSLRLSPSRPERKYMHCLRWPIAEVPPDARCYQLTWYKR
jgi:hypothetical protein